MSNHKHAPVSLALCTALAGGLALSASAFAMQPMAQGYLLAPGTATAGEKAAEGKCGAGKMAEGKCGSGMKAGEGKCGAGMKAGEGKCGMDKADTDKDGKISRAEFSAAHADQVAQFDAIDTNKDGFMDAAEHKAHHQAKQADPSKKADAAEGKCGEGKCGGKM